MSLEPNQADSVRILKERRSHVSFVGGSTVFNVAYPPRSPDLDVYVENASLSDIADGDIAALQRAGYMVQINRSFYGLVVEAQVSREAQSTSVEWSDADRERFFLSTERHVGGERSHGASAENSSTANSP